MDKPVYKGVVVRNLPPNMTDEDIRKFLESKGLSADHTFIKVHRSSRKINVDVEKLISDECHELIENLNEKVFFDRKIYCVGMDYVHTPVKNNNVEKDETASATQNVVKTPIV